eukprot:4894695-Pleurochrysis_carterae.AAC.1
MKAIYWVAADTTLSQQARGFARGRDAIALIAFTMSLLSMDLSGLNFVLHRQTMNSVSTLFGLYALDTANTECNSDDAPYRNEV